MQTQTLSPTMRDWTSVHDKVRSKDRDLIATKSGELIRSASETMVVFEQRYGENTGKGSRVVMLRPGIDGQLEVFHTMFVPTATAASVTPRTGYCPDESTRATVAVHLAVSASPRTVRPLPTTLHPRPSIRWHVVDIIGATRGETMTVLAVCTDPAIAAEIACSLNAAMFRVDNDKYGEQLWPVPNS